MLFCWIFKKSKGRRFYCPSRNIEIGLMQIFQSSDNCGSSKVGDILLEYMSIMIVLNMTEDMSSIEIFMNLNLPVILQILFQSKP